MSPNGSDRSSQVGWDLGGALDGTSFEAGTPLGVLPIAGRRRRQIVNPFDGRYGAMDPTAVRLRVKHLAELAQLDGVGFVLGIPEGGNAPAFAFAEATGLPLVLAASQRPESPAIRFAEPHVQAFERDKWIMGLAPGDSVIVVEDEVTTGRTIVDCVVALRSAGVRCDQVATLLAVDDAEMRRRLEEAAIRLYVAHWLDREILERILVDG